MKRPDEIKRRYDDACGTAHALELLGERWTLLVLRELMLGPRRFSDLREDLPGISARVLTQRLAEMEAKGLVVRYRLPPPASVQVYDASDWGREAEPILQTMGRWAARSPGHDPSLPISAVSVLLSFRTMIDGERAGERDGVLRFVFGERVYTGTIAAGRFTVAAGADAAPDVTLAGAPEQLVGVAYGGAPLELLGVEGDAELARWFFSLFALPEKVTG
ncbi:winged helix-turn-helix transcriptional regulator [Sphingomicrobium arenosum]|uniref:winged helix-turn-helix transcriptional regulator n=1 Tax=Sphingomicrobium arenosum TaxID=2233861 RepID=UPI002240FD9E|nr:winged helix-turn-helix transcriptional regulator [Sphingomicrobium arenosum]